MLKKISRQYPEIIIMNTDYADDSASCKYIDPSQIPAA